MDNVKARIVSILLGSWSVIRRGWWRFILVIAAMTALAGIAALVAYTFMPTLVYAQRELILDQSGAGVAASGIILVALELSIPLFAIVLLLLSVALGTVTSLAGDIRARRRPRFMGSIVRGGRRALPLAGASVLVVLALLASFLLAPVLVVVGLLGMLVTPLVRAGVARWGAPRWAAQARWPGMQFFGILAIPFSATVLLFAWWGLAVPVTTFERGGPFTALRRSRELVSRDFWPVSLSLLVGAVVYVASQLAVSALAGLGWGDDAIVIARVASQTILASIPVVIAAVAYQSVVDGGPKTVDTSDDVRPVGRGLTAATLSIALVAGLLIPVAGSVTPAWGEDLPDDQGAMQVIDQPGGAQNIADSAEPTDPSGVPDSSGEADEAGEDGDDPTPGDLVATGGDISKYVLSSPGETFRSESFGGESPGGENPGGENPGGGGTGIPDGAFIVDSLADLTDQTPGDGVCADSTGTCTLRAAVAEANHWGGPDNTVAFAVDGTIALGATIDITAELTINGAGHRVTIDGNGTTQLLRVAAGVDMFSLRFLTLSNGRGDANGGGALQSSTEDGSVSSVTFVGNSSVAPGGAVSILDGGSVNFENSTFWQNSAPLGSDIANIDGAANVNLSTFVPSGANSLHNASAMPNSFTVYKSIVSGACTGDELEWPIAGGASIGHPSCFGDEVTPVSGLGTFGDHGGWVNTVSLTPDSPAVDAYYGTPNSGIDARGVSRSQGCGLDFGAFELEIVCVRPPDDGPWDPWMSVVGNHTDVSAFGEEVTFQVYLRSPKTGTPDFSGTVTFTAGGVAMAPVQVAPDGMASVTLNSLPVGSSTITASYSGDGNYTARTSDPLVHTIQAIPTGVVVTSGAATVTGQSTTVTATVSAGAAGGPALGGTVEFAAVPIGSNQSLSLGEAAVVGGVASVDTSLLAWGDSTIYASFIPDSSSYVNSQGTAVHTVNSASTSVALTTVDPNSVFGQSVVFTATVAVTAPGRGNPIGTMVFNDGATTNRVTVVNGSASFSTGGLGVGSNTVNAQFIPQAGGSWPFESSTVVTTTVTVAQAPTSIVVTSTPSSSTVGESVILMAEVSAKAPGAGTPSGTVDFRLGGASLGSATLASGYAFITTTGLPIGAQQLEVVYGGDTRYLGTTQNHNHLVKTVSTTVTVASDTGTAVTGQVVRYTATVQTTGQGVATPSGTVDFSGLVHGTATVQANGTAVLDAVIPPSSSASANVSVRYIPADGLSAESFGFVVQQLMPASTTVTATAADVGLGDPVALVVDVTGNSPSTTKPTRGNIVVLKGGQTLATVSVPGTWPVTVNLATLNGLGIGSHSLTVIYRDGIGFRDSTTTATVKVGPADSTVNLLLSPSGSVEHGTTVTVKALVSVPFGLIPTGPVTIFEGSTQLYSGFVAASGADWEVSFDTSGLAVGDHHFRAVYDSWNPSIAGSATAQDTDFTVSRVPTVTTLVIGPRLVNDPFSWTVFVRTDRPGAALPSGSVRLTVDGNVLLAVALRDDPNSALQRYATVTPPPSLSLPTSSFTVTAEYLPDDPFAASSAQGTQYIVDYLPTVTLSARTTAGGTWQNAINGVAWGTSVEVRAEVADSAGAPGAPAPTGTIVIAGGEASAICTILSPGGSCTLAWPKSGSFTVTAHYEGDAHYAPDSRSVLYASIDRKTPSFFQAGIQNPTVVTGDPVTAFWGVAGPAPDEGTVQVAFGDAPGCSVAVDTGRCSSSYTIGSAGRPQTITVRYLQNDRWNEITKTIQVTPLGCYPLDLVVNPGEGGTLTALSVKNCNNGSGYIDGTEVWVRPTALPNATSGLSWRFAGFTPALAGPGPDYPVGVGVGTGKTTRLAAQFDLDVQCVTVRVSPQFSTSTAQLKMLSTPNCPLTGSYLDSAGWQRTADAGYSGRFLLGSEVRTTVQLGGTEDVVYGYRWDSANGGVTQRSAEAFVVDRDTRVWVVAGPQCYEVAVSATGPGAVKASGDQLGCVNPAKQAAGWPANTVLELTATPEYRELSYVDGWSGFTPESSRTFVSDQALKTTHTAETVKFTVEPGSPPTVLGVHFGTCHKLTISPVLQGSAKGKVDVTPTNNCPVIADELGLFKEGTEVALHAGNTDAFGYQDWKKEAAFGKWNLDDGDDANADRTLVIDEDITLRPSFFVKAAAGCVPLHLVSNDPGRTRVGMTNKTFADDAICHHGTLADGPAAELSGTVNRELEIPVSLNTENLSGNPLLGWQLEIPGKGKLGQLGAQIDLTGLRSPLTATSFACQAIEPLVALNMENGEVITERVEAGSELIMTKPAPNCPYAEDAWIVGTTVELAALGDPSGYTPTGWSGAATGTGVNTTVHLDGSSPTVSVTASYDVTCYTLTLTHDAKDVTSYPAPNCRGTDPALNRYVGGTLVSMYGKVPGGKIWQGWTGDVVQTGKVNPAFVIMDADKSAGHRWRSKSWDEEIVGGFEWFGDQVAIAAKKAVGVVALALKEVAGAGLAAVPPFALIATIGPALSLLGTILEYAGVSDDITKYLHYANDTFDWMLSAFQCAAAWSFSSSGGGGSGSGESKEEEAARKALEAYDAATTVKDTAELVLEARKAYVGAAKAASSEAGAVGFGVTVGISVASTILDSGIGWESDAKSAWTDGSVFTGCMEDSLPSYLGDVVDGFNVVKDTMESAG